MRSRLPALALVFALACGSSPDPAAPPSEPAPAAVAPLDDDDRLAVAAGYACVITARRRVVCWGNVPPPPIVDAPPDEWSDLLGLAIGEEPGAGPAHPIPPTVIPELEGSVEITGSGDALCARDGSGAVRCWGRLFGTQDPARDRPLLVAGLRGAGALAVGDDLACGIVEERVRCAIGRAESDAADVGIDRALELVASGGPVCARRRDASIACVARAGERVLARAVLRGAERARPLADLGSVCAWEGGVQRCVDVRLQAPESTTAGSTALQVVDAATPEIDLAAGEVRPLAEARLGFTHLGLGCTLSAEGLFSCDERSESPRLEHVRTARLGEHESGCALLEGDRVVCWGDNDHGQSGPMPSRPGAPTRVEPLPLARAVARGGRTTCALARDGALWCWSDRRGWSRPRPVEDMPPLTRIGSSADAVCGADDDGPLRCSCHIEAEPTLVTHASIVGVRALARHRGQEIAALDGGGRVLVVRPCAEADQPRELLELRGSTSIAAGETFTCGIVAGELRCEGVAPGRRGLAGPDPLAGRARPARPRAGARVPPPLAPRLTGVGRVLGGGEQICIEREAGTLVCWGHNGVGQLGLPPSHPILDPQEIPALGGVAIAGASFEQHASCWWHGTGPLTCAGLDDDLQPRREDDRGDGSTREIPGPRDVVGAFVGEHACAVTARGEVWCWGGPPRGDGLPSWREEAAPIALPPDA